MKMMIVTLSTAVMIGAAGTGVLWAADANRSSQSNLLSTQNHYKQSIGADRAKQLALAIAPGHFLSVELEVEHGFSYYKVKIQQGSRKSIVMVDAYTGKVFTQKKPSTTVRRGSDDTGSDDHGGKGRGSDD